MWLGYVHIVTVAATQYVLTSVPRWSVTTMSSRPGGIKTPGLVIDVVLKPLDTDDNGKAVEY